MQKGQKKSILPQKNQLWDALFKNWTIWVFFPPCVALIGTNQQESRTGFCWVFPPTIQDLISGIAKKCHWILFLGDVFQTGKTLNSAKHGKMTRISLKWITNNPYGLSPTMNSPYELCTYYRYPPDTFIKSHYTVSQPSYSAPKHTQLLNLHIFQHYCNALSCWVFFQ